MKRISAFACLILSLVFMLTGCKIETVKQHNQSNSKSDKDKISVSLEVRCDTILNNMDKADKIKDLIPADGIILKEEKFEISKDSSVYDLLIEASKQKSFSVVSTGTNKTAYITSISGIEEFSVGAMSGWKYSVNDEFASKSCGEYKLKSDDKVKLLFTCDLGEDLK